MDVMILTFRVAGLSAGAYRLHARDLAAKLTQVPGLLERTWQVDEPHQTFGWVFRFRDRATLERFARSSLVAALRGQPGITDLDVRVFATVEPAPLVGGARPARFPAVT